MKMSWRSSLLLFVPSALILLLAIATRATDARQTTPASEPQLVRVSYVDGDVRVNRGDGKGAADLQKPWEPAVVNFPIERGCALATDEGRAVVEFESGSMIYLAPHSVVLFNEITDTGGQLETHLQLVSGTLSTNVLQTSLEHFVVGLPTGQIEITYPESSYLRID